jgi:hypothetical protein
MGIIFNILIMFAMAFAIGMFVAFIIWFLYNTMNAEGLQRFRHRESYREMKQLKQKKVKTA